MLVIGLDVGTTGTKAVVADEKGEVLGTGYKEYKLKSSDGCVTQNAADWWDAAIYAVRVACERIDDVNQIRGISLSTQGASMLCADRDGNALCDVITWMDTRSSQEAERFSTALGAKKIYKKCGWMPSPVLDAAKILWIKEHDPELFDSSSYFISTLEYMNIKLTGNNVIDPTNAAIRQLFNIEKSDWDDEILSYIGFGREKLASVLPIGTCVGKLTREASDALGLSDEVCVFNGAHDQYCAAVGSGAVNTGDMLLATGTTWVVLGVTDSLLYTDSHMSPGIHAVPGKFGAMASLVSAGSALNWYKGIIGDDFKTIDAGAEKCAESAENLFVLPYVCGAGFPHSSPDARGAMFGLDAGHTKYDIARAVMEGVAFEAAGVLDLFAAQGMNISKLMMTGGAARSRLWSEIVGYATGCEIYRMKEPETCCMGAAMTAAVGLGIYKDYNACGRAMVKSEKLILGNTAMTDFYKKKRAKYNSLSKLILK